MSVPPDPQPGPLPAAMQIALGYAGPATRPLFAGLFALDTHCAHLLRRSTEPMLAQMRLTWWREALARPAAERARGSPLLAALENWTGEDQALIRLVDGWEHLVGASPLPARDMERFAALRADAFASVARLLGLHTSEPLLRQATYRWALAELVQGLSHPAERACALELARHADMAVVSLPRALRPLAVLDALARRALAKGGSPLLAGRTSALVALRAGLLGR